MKVLQLKIEEIKEADWEEVEMLVDEVWLRKEVSIAYSEETKLVRSISLKDGFVIGIVTIVEGEKEKVYFDKQHFSESNINVMLSFLKNKESYVLVCC